MKKMISRRSFIKACAVAASAAALNACGSSSNSVSSTSVAASESTAQTVKTYDDVQKPDNILWWVHDGMKQEDGTEQWVAEYERMTGVDLTLQIIDNNEYYTKLELAYAADTVPNTFDLNGENLSNYAVQGAIADLTDLIHESGVYDRLDKKLWDSLELGGRLYGVPRAMPTACVSYVRKDWLDRLGMDIPTNYAEFIEMLTAFKEKIPECTVPYTAPGLKSAQAMPEFYHGAIPDYRKIDGKWVDGMAQDDMLVALKNMQEAYAAGLIDMEVVTNTTSACRDQWYSGSVGVFAYWSGNWGLTLSDRLKRNVPDAEVVAMPPLAESTYLLSAPSSQVISSKLDSDKIAGIFKYFIDFGRDGGEGQILFRNGVENLHWKQEGDKLVPLPCLSNPEDTFLKAWGDPATPMLLTDKNVDVKPEISNSEAIANEYAEPIYVLPVSETRTMISSDLTTARENIIARVVMGQLTPEDGLAEYKKQADLLGVAQALEEMNANA